MSSLFMFREGCRTAAYALVIAGLFFTECRAEYLINSKNCCDGYRQAKYIEEVFESIDNSNIRNPDSVILGLIGLIAVDCIRRRNREYRKSSKI